jgi:hypothetical protein
MGGSSVGAAGEKQIAVQQVDGRWRCTLCGALINVPSKSTPYVALKAASGGPTMRTLNVDGHEIHRCPLGAESAPS